jgi:hypothetical protein
MNSAQKAVAATAKLVEVLGGLDSEERGRAISAAMVLLGDSNRALAEARQRPSAEMTIECVDGLPAKAVAWAKKNDLELDQLEHVFTIDHDGVDVIAARAPGKSKRLQTIGTYLLCGLASLLARGDLSFTDDDARELCKKLGAFDSPNHFNYVKGLGNLVAGSKEAGWKLTNPGLARAAEIVRQLVPAKNA